jgi:DNA-binding transcriptional ArsR family regulator
VNSTAELDRSFLVLSHPVRRAIIERLAFGPATVGEATRGLGVSKPAVSKHVRLLEDAGIVRRFVEGRRHRLELSGRPLGDVPDWLERNRSLWEAKFDAVERHLAEGRERGNGR